jgi:hypothetical protein
MTVLFQNLMIACIVGIIGIAIGAATLRLDVEKLDERFPMTGIILCLIPIMDALVMLIKSRS